MERRDRLIRPVPGSVVMIRWMTILLSILPFVARAQRDSLWLSNGNIIVGELKDMARGVATLETPYSDSDFKIEWSEVRKVRTESTYLVQTVHGDRYTARLHSTDTGHVRMRGGIDSAVVLLGDIVYLKSVKADFWSRASASIDFGYNYTKANNLQQYSARCGVGYLTDRWSTAGTFNFVRSTQDDVDPIRRTDVGANYRRTLPHNFFAAMDISFLSNTEQLLDLRSSYQPTIGYYVARTNSMYLLGALGGAYTHEDYSTDAPRRESFEGLIGVELNMFDTGDLSLLLSSKAFPNFTEAGRWRMDHRFDVKYDLPLDLYVRAGITLNYDNRPVEGAPETDYVIQTALGWEL